MMRSGQEQGPGGPAATAAFHQGPGHLWIGVFRVSRNRSPWTQRDDCGGLAVVLWSRPGHRAVT